MYPSIVALGYSEAAMVRARPDAGDVRAVISIHGRREFPIEAHVRHRLVLQFDDEDVPDATDPLAVYRSHVRLKWAAEQGLDLRPPSAEDAAAITDFAGKVRHVSGTVLCQCAGGISRSPAAALLCLAVWTGEGREQWCVDELLRLRPAAAPHRDLTRFGDALLGRDGRLTRAVIDARRRDD